MRIVYLCGFPLIKQRYGVSEHVYQLSNALARRYRSSSCHIVSMHTETSTRCLGPRLWLHTIERRPHHYVCPHFASARLTAEIDGIRPDLIHLHGTTLPYVLAALRAHRRYPVVLTLHGVIEQETRYKAIWARIWDRLLMIPLRDAMVHAASNVITCSQTVRGRLGRLQEGRTHVIPNGIDLAQFALADRVKEVEKNYILYLGRLNKLKGVDLLIEALPRVYDRAGTIPVYIAGTGPESEMLRDLVKKREVDKTVSFLGFVEGKRKASLIRNAGVVVLPSRFENSPLTVLEAMACGRPVVAARVGGIPELVIEGSTGLLFEADNTVQLADRIVTVLQNPDIRRKLGSEAHRRARAHSWAIVAKRVREVYQASLRQGG